MLKVAFLPLIYVDFTIAICSTANFYVFYFFNTATYKNGTILKLRNNNTTQFFSKQHEKSQ